MEVSRRGPPVPAALRSPPFLCFTLQWIQSDCDFDGGNSHFRLHHIHRDLLFQGPSVQIRGDSGMGMLLCVRERKGRGGGGAVRL